MMASLYADENVPTGLVERLRALGQNVRTVREAGKAGSNDPQVLSDAIADGRAVLTFNRWDFDRLHRRDPAHCGIVSCSEDDDLDALAARVDQAINAAGSLTGQHLRVDRLS